MEENTNVSENEEKKQKKPKMSEEEMEEKIRKLEVEYFIMEEDGYEKTPSAYRLRYRLGMAYYENGMMDRAYDTLKDVYRVWRRRMDETDATLLKLMHMLGVSAMYSEYPYEAYELLKEVFEIRYDIMGPKHKMTLQTLLDLMRVCRYLSARSEFNKYKAQYEQLSGKECKLEY